MLIRHHLGRRRLQNPAVHRERRDTVPTYARPGVVVQRVAAGRLYR